MQKQFFFPDYRSDTSVSDKKPYHIDINSLQRDSVITKLHYHTEHEFGFCLEGAGIFIVAGNVMEFKKGDAISIAAGEPHLAQSIPGTISRWHWIYLDVDRLLLAHFPELDTGLFSRLCGNNFSNILDAVKYPELCSYIERMSRIRHEKDELAALTALIFFEMKRLFAGAVEDKEEQFCGNSFEQIRKAVQYFVTHYSEKVTIPHVAKLCGMSHPHFRKIFRQAMGCSPQRYLNTIRIQMAVAELKKRKSTGSEIALNCGFDSVSSFNRQFKQIKGCSPSELLSGKKII